jgi:hypothetical protein
MAQNMKHMPVLRLQKAPSRRKRLRLRNELRVVLLYPGFDELTELFRLLQEFACFGVARRVGRVVVNDVSLTTARVEVIGELRVVGPQRDEFAASKVV